MKKHWIYIKRGLSEDPKHRAQMGECIWLFMHIIDRADWETGIAYDWKDKEEAADMAMPVDTLRYQRQKLEEMDYIRSKKKQHSQDIYIMEWKNPRDYGSEIKNPRIQSSNELPLSETQSDNQSLNQSSNQLPRQIKTPTFDSINQDSPSLIRDERSNIFSIYEREIGPLTPFIADELEEAVQVHGEAWVGEALKIASANGKRNWAYAKGILSRWKSEGYGAQKKTVQAEQKPAINENEIERTRKMLEEKDKNKRTPRPSNVPPPSFVSQRMADLAKEKGIVK